MDGSSVNSTQCAESILSAVDVDKRLFDMLWRRHAALNVEQLRASIYAACRVSATVIWDIAGGRRF